MRGTVRDVSATLVASTTRRPPPGPEHLVLFGGAQARVQRQELRAGRVMLAQHFRRIADLALAWQEHQHVARPLGAQLVHRIAESLLFLLAGGVLRVPSD